MSKLFAYSGILTKVKGMESHLLTKKDYEDLSSLRSVNEYILYLKSNKGYSTTFDTLNENHIHRGEIEYLLNLSIFTDFSKLYLFANQSQRMILDLFFARFEINLLKLLITGHFSKSKQVDLTQYAEFFKKRTTLDINTLISAPDLEQLIVTLKPTPYYAPLNALHESGVSVSLYDYENRLDVYYFLRTWKLSEHLKNKYDRKIIKQLIGTQIDFLNIMWTYRSKRFYNTPSSMIYSNIIPIHYKLTDATLNQLITAASPDDLLELLKHTPYRRLVSDLDDFHLEKRYYQLRLKFLHAIKMKYPLSMASILYFFYEKEMEIDHLTTILECIRYQIQPNQILTYLSLDQLEEST